MSFKPFENLENENEDPKKANLMLMIFFTVMSLAAVVLIPFAGFAGLAFMPVPVTLLFLSNRYRDAIICAIAGVLVLFIFNYVLAVIIVIMIFALAVNYKYIIVRSKSLTYALPSVFAILIVSVILFILVDSVMLRQNIAKELLATYNSLVDNLNEDPLIKNYQNLFFSGSAQLDEAIGQTQRLLKYLPSLLPGFALIFFGLSTVLNYRFSFILLKKHNIKLEPLPLFKDWDLSWYYCWGVITGIILLVIPKFNPAFDRIIDAAGYNLLIVFGLLYAVLGAAVLWGLLEKFNVRVLVRVIIIIVMFLFFGFGAVLPLMGLIDIWANFRKINRAL